MKSRPSACASANNLLALGRVVPGVLDQRPRAEVVARDAQAVALGDGADLLRGPVVVVAAELDLRDPRVGEDLADAGEIELVVGHQVAHRKRLHADPVERDVAATPEAEVLIAVASVPVRAGHARERTQCPDCRRATGCAQQATPRDRDGV
jgi:hypothetical protein